jgi:hypothetical protein
MDIGRRTVQKKNHQTDGSSEILETGEYTR